MSVLWVEWSLNSEMWRKHWRDGVVSCLLFTCPFSSSSTPLLVITAKSSSETLMGGLKSCHDRLNRFNKLLWFQPYAAQPRKWNKQSYENVLRIAIIPICAIQSWTPYCWCPWTRQRPVPAHGFCFNDLINIPPWTITTVRSYSESLPSYIGFAMKWRKTSSGHKAILLANVTNQSFKENHF